MKIPKVGEHIIIFMTLALLLLLAWSGFIYQTYFLNQAPVTPLPYPGFSFVAMGLLTFVSVALLIGWALRHQQRDKARAEYQRLFEIEREQRLLAESLGKAFLALTGRTSEMAVFEEILRQAQQLVSYSAANIMLAENETLRVVHWCGYETFGGESWTTNFQQSLAEFPVDAEVLQLQKPVVIADVRQDPRWKMTPVSTWIRSFLAMPLCLNQQAIGILRLDSDKPGHFSTRDVERLWPLADAAAVALEKARLYDRLRAELRERKQAEEKATELHHRLFAMQYAGAAVAASTDLNQILQIVAAEMASLMGVDRCLILELDQTRATVSTVAHHETGKQSQNLQENDTRDLADVPLIKLVLTSRQAEQATPDQPDLDPVDLSYTQVNQIKTLLLLPMEVQGQVLGLIEVAERGHAREFRYEEIALAQFLANQAAVTIKNVHLYAEVKQRLKEEIALQKAGAAISASLDLETVLNHIAQQMGQVVDATSAYICSYEPEAKTSTVLAEYFGPRVSEQEKISDVGVSYLLPRDFSDDFNGLLSGQPEIIHLSQPSVAEDERSHMQTFGAQTIVNIPLQVKDRLIAFAELWESRRQREFTAEEISLCQSIAQQAAVALENARLYDQAQQELALRRQVEQALRKSEARYKAIVEDQTELICRFWPDGRLTFVNESYCRYFGKTREQMLGCKFLPTIVEEDRERVQEHLASINQDQPIASYENRVMSQSGEMRWQYWTNRALFNEQGELVEFQSVGRDITKRKLAEIALQQSEEKFRMLAETTAAAIFIYQGDRICYANPAGEIISGYSLDELLSMNFWDLMHPDFQELVKTRGQSRLESKTVIPRYEVKIITKAGEERWLDVSLGVITFEGNQAVLGTAFDITTRKQAEEALRESEANLKAIFESSLQAFILIDRDHRVQAFNKMAELGIQLFINKELKVGNLIYDYMTPEDMAEFDQHFDQVLQGKSVKVERIMSVNGADIWFELYYNPVFAGNDEVIGVCFSTVNIDERKRMTEMLVESEQRLLAEMKSVLTVTRALVTETDLEHVLEFMLIQAKYLTGSDGAAVLLLNDNKQQLDVFHFGEADNKMKLITLDEVGLQMCADLPVSLIKDSLADVALKTQEIQVSQQAMNDGQIASIRVLLQAGRIKTVVCAPLVVFEKNLGVLVLWGKHRRKFSEGDYRLITLFADQAALALNNASLHVLNRELAIEQERRRIARELHDTVNQTLYSIGMAAEGCLKFIDQKDRTKIRRPVQYIHLLSKTALKEIRERVHGLYPTALTERRLLAVLEEYSNTLREQHNLTITFMVDQEPELSLYQREHLYYIAREALSNVVKHAGATRVKIILTGEADQITFTVEDNGPGFIESTSMATEMIGLRSMKERAKLLDGSFEIESNPGFGTRVTVQIPARIGEMVKT